MKNFHILVNCIYEIKKFFICGGFLLTPVLLYILMTILISPFFQNYDNTDFISYLFSIFISAIIIYHLKLYNYIKIGKVKKQLFLYLLGIIILGFLLLFVMKNHSFQFSLHFTKFLFVRYIKTICFAAIFEEILFRGIAFEYLKKKSVNKWVILFFTSLLFGLIHLPGLFYFINTFIFAMFVGVVYLKERNLTYPIAMHSLYNLFWIIFY